MVHRKKSAEKVAPKAPAKPETSAARIRGWAKEKGIPCPERGRIPSKVMELYAGKNIPGLIEEAVSEEVKDNPIFHAHGKRHDAACQFCTINTVSHGTRHDLCPGTIRNADPRHRHRVWTCPCWQQNPEGHTRAKDYRPA